MTRTVLFQLQPRAAVTPCMHVLVREEMVWRKEGENKEKERKGEEKGTRKERCPVGVISSSQLSLLGAIRVALYTYVQKCKYLLRARIAIQVTTWVNLSSKLCKHN